MKRKKAKAREERGQKKAPVQPTAAEPVAAAKQARPAVPRPAGPAATPASRKRAELLVSGLILLPLAYFALRAVRTLVHRHEKHWMSVLSEDELRDYIALLHRIQDSPDEE